MGFFSGESPLARANPDGLIVWIGRIQVGSTRNEVHPQPDKGHFIPFAHFLLYVYLAGVFGIGPCHPPVLVQCVVIPLPESYL